MASCWKVMFCFLFQYLQYVFLAMTGNIAANERRAKLKFVLANIFVVFLYVHKIITSQYTSDIVYRNFTYPVILAGVQNNVDVSKIFLKIMQLKEN